MSLYAAIFKGGTFGRELEYKRSDLIGGLIQCRFICGWCVGRWQKFGGGFWEKGQSPWVRLIPGPFSLHSLLSVPPLPPFLSPLPPSSACAALALFYALLAIICFITGPEAMKSSGHGPQPLQPRAQWAFPPLS